MGKASMCIRMLQLLNSGRTYKCSELADMLETNPRNVIEYKKELEEAGYCIISVPGKNGGYRLDMTTTIPSLKFTKDEMSAIADGAGYLEARKDFLLKKDFKTAMSKVYSSVKHSESQFEPLVVSRFPLAMSEEGLEERYLVIKDCIKKSYVLKIEYLSLYNEQVERFIEPYTIFMYNNSWYIIAFDQTDNDFRYYKINRILKFNKINQKFRKRLSYNEFEYLDDFGMKHNGEWYPIKLKITGAYAIIVREREYGRNQKIEAPDAATTILSCDMQNKDRVISLVLSMGEFCDIIEPEWLKEEVKCIAQKILGTYS